MIKFHTIIGDSMFPTLKNGEQIAINTKTPLKRNDIVVLKNPDAHSKDKYVVKRVLGIEGDIVSFKRKHIFVNNEDFGKSKVYDENLSNLVIPKGKIFICGDNRNRSYDSRYYGPISTKAIRGVFEYKAEGVPTKKGKTPTKYKGFFAKVKEFEPLCASSSNFQEALERCMSHEFRK